MKSAAVCHALAPPLAAFEAQVFMFVLARRRLIKCLPSKRAARTSARALSKVTSRPAKNELLFPLGGSTGRTCLCHKLELEIVRNYIKFLLAHTREMETLQTFSESDSLGYPCKLLKLLKCGLSVLAGE